MCKILVVEDEIFVATEIENIVAELGYDPVGIAADSRTALALAPEAEVALVDLNLLDGATGSALGGLLHEKFGISVLFMTANPAQLGDGVPGTIGVLPKPVSEKELREAVQFVVAHRRDGDVPAPSRMRLFEATA